MDTVMRPGYVVADRFEIERLAASGGMGAVYRARELPSGRVVALKVVKSGGPEDEMRFAREALVLAELDHPSIVRYIAHGFTSDGESYLAMEWLSGEDLGTRISREGVTVAESVSLGQSVASALAVLHARGVVHRDVKPSNIFLPEGSIDRVKLLDFGLAQQRGATGSATRRGALMGTLGYLSPEAVRSAGVDARADVFSLGCVLFECLTGQPAFSATHVAAVLSKILFDEPPKVGEICEDVPEELESLVSRMLSKDPASRPADGAAVAAELADLGGVLSSPRSAPRSRSPALSGEELSPVAVIAISGAVEHLNVVSRIISPFDARLAALPGGLVLLTLAGNVNAGDQALQAARCAISLRAALPDAPMSMVAGRAVLAGSQPSGPAVERSIELVGKAAGVDRGIVVDEVIRRLLDGRFQITTSSEGLILRGERGLFTETVPPQSGRISSCVGRERELSALSALLEECVGEPRCRAVLVTGPAGIGKSRLRRAFLEQAQQRDAAGAEIWVARGDPVRSGAPLGMAAQLLRQMAGILLEDPPESARAKLRSRVARRVPVEHVPRVAGLLDEVVFGGSSTEPARDASPVVKDAHRSGEQVRRAFEDLIVAELAAGPVVIVLEDLHWGDRPSVALIDACLRLLRERPLFVLALARPSVHDSFPRLWDDRGVQEMRLEDLSRKAAERLIRESLGPTAARASIERIAALGSGNARVLEELTRAEKEGKGGAVPETVLLLTEALLSVLTPEVRRALRAGSIFGEVFYSGGVRALLGEAYSTGALESCLAALVDREIIRRCPESSLPGQEAFAFRRPLLREATYGMLTPEDRALGHRLAADWLARAGEQDLTVIAGHFERGGATRRAAAVYFGAAAQALELNDFDAAIAGAQRAATTAVEHDAIGEARRLQAEAHAWRGDVVETERYGLEAMDLLLREAPSWFTAAACVATAAFRRGDRGRLLDVANELCQAPVSEDVRPHQLAALARLGYELLYLGAARQADAIFREVESAPEEARRVPLVAAGISAAFALSASLGGEIERALRSAEAAVARYEQAGTRRAAARQRVRLAVMRAASGAALDVETELRGALAIAHQERMASTAAWVKPVLALALARRGAIDEARAMVDEAIADAVQRRSTVIEAEARACSARILLFAARPEDALREARLTLELSERLPRTRVIALALAAQARLALKLPAEALALATAGRDLLTRMGGVIEGEAFVRLTLVEALAAGGDESAAKSAAIAARERLIERAAKIEDGAMRKRFLELPDHARTIAVWQRVTGGAGGAGG